MTKCAALLLSVQEVSCWNLPQNFHRLFSMMHTLQKAFQWTVCLTQYTSHTHTHTHCPPIMYELQYMTEHQDHIPTLTRWGLSGLTYIQTKSVFSWHILTLITTVSAYLYFLLLNNDYIMDTVAQLSNADKLNANSTQTTSIHKKSHIIHRITRNEQKIVRSLKKYSIR